MTARHGRHGGEEHRGVTVGGVSSTARIITVGYYAAAEDAAGTPRERLHTEASTVGEFASEICERHGEPLASIVAVSSFLLGDETTRDPTVSLDGVVEIDVLPPFAGG